MHIGLTLDYQIDAALPGIRKYELDRPLQLAGNLTPQVDQQTLRVVLFIQKRHRRPAAVLGNPQGTRYRRLTEDRCGNKQQ